jgi:hypothetical protein
MGPSVKESPNVASASPYAVARSAGRTQSEMYANVTGNVAQKMPDNAIAILNNTMFSVQARTTIGDVVPITVTNKMFRLPKESDNLPKIGQAANAPIPFTNSVMPIARYALSPK